MCSAKVLLLSVQSQHTSSLHPSFRVIFLLDCSCICNDRRRNVCCCVVGVFLQQIYLYISLKMSMFYKGNKLEAAKTTESVFLKWKTTCHPRARYKKIYKTPFRHTIGCKRDPRPLLTLKSPQDSEITQQQLIVRKFYTFLETFLSCYWRKSKSDSHSPHIKQQAW